MKNRIQLSLLLFMFLIVTMGNAQQDFQGEATYKTLTKFDINLDEDDSKSAIKSSSISPEIRKQLRDQLKKGSQQTYTLSFDKEQSLYKKEEQLSTPQPNSSGIRISFSGGAGDILYKNTKENRYTNQNEVFSKVFLIQDELEKHEWKLEDETKNIGQYTCFKATKTITRTVNVGGVSFSFNSNKDDEEKKPETREEEITVVAWYTPQIPVSTGPDIYHGLPGLILEVNDGRTTTICSKVVLNPNGKKGIKEPKSGKKVNQKEYDEIVEKRTEEQRKQFSTGGGRIFSTGG